MKLPKEDIFDQVKAYVGAVKPILLQQIRFHLYLAHGASTNHDTGYNRHWKNSKNYRGIDFLINSLEIHRNSTLNFAADIRQNRELFKDALYNLLELLNVSVKEENRYDLKGLNLIFSFHKDLERVIDHAIAKKPMS